MMGNVPGVPPPTVPAPRISTVGRAAARTALVAGVEVLVLDWDLRQLGMINRESGGQVVTVTPSAMRLERYTAIADVLIGAVHIPGERSPLVVTEAMVKDMKPGSVIVDVAIDQGGCVETARSTTHEDPTYIVDEVVHYCVANMPGAVPKTSTYALNNVTLPFALALADRGIKDALLADDHLLDGLNVCRGVVTEAHVAEALDLPYVQPAAALEAG